MLKRIAVFAAYLIAASTVCAQPFVFTDVSVIDVVEGSVKPGMSVLVEHDRITAMGATGTIVIPSEATLIDARGKYLIPGLWDMHTHLLWSTDATEYYYTEMPKGLDSWTLWEQYYGPTLDLLLANGVTGIRDMSGNLDVARRVQREANADRRVAPRMVIAGQVIDGPPPLWPGILVATSPDEARSAVDSLVAAGAAFIKVRNRIRPDVFQAIASRTQELDIPLAGHVPWLIRAADAADLGQRSVEHLTGVVEGCSGSQEELIELNREILEALVKRENAVSDSLDNQYFNRLLATPDNARCRSLLQHLAQTETWQTPTLVLQRGLDQHLNDDDQNSDDSLLKYIHPDWRSSWAPENNPYGQWTEEAYRQRKRWYERKQQIVGMATEVDVPILAGTDTPNARVFPGFSLHEEMELLVKSGLTPLEALQAATINPVRFIGADDSLGTVEEGKLADLVLLDANPLDKITNTQRIRAVVTDGQLYRLDELERLLAGVEESFKQSDRKE